MTLLSNDAFFASLIAPIIDRVAISIHPAVDKQAVDSLRGANRFHPAALSMLAGTLAAGPITAAEYSELSRYQHFGSSDVFLQGLADRGGVELLADGSFVATTEAAEVARRLVVLQCDAATTLFAPRSSSLSRLRAWLDQACVAASTDPNSTLAAYASRAWMPDDATDAAHIWNNAVILRLHRSDAHAVAWKQASHDANSIRTLAAGPDRDAIEDQTNTLAATAWCSLSKEERLHLLAGLGALPGNGSPI